jgi:hypothetical protein
MWFRSIRHRSQSQRGKRRSPAVDAAVSRACVEALEGRQLLSFTPAGSYPAGTDPQGVITADLNGDGRLDLAAANPSTDTLSVMLASADGTFAAPLSIATGTGPRSVAVGDFNEDGTLDLATANGADLSILIGNGDGAFGAPGNISIGSDPASIAVGDFNGDGKLDLGVASNSVYYWPEYGYGMYFAQANVLLGNGDGSFAAPISNWIDYGYHTSAAVADLNGDGIQDFASTNADYINILFGDGTGHLQGAGVFYTDYGPVSLAAGDVDHDGDIDLVTANQSWNGNTISVLLADGAGGFGPAQNLPAPSATSLTLGDFDRDGNVDLATASVSHVGILRGDGDGRFAPLEPFAAGAGAYSVAAGDFNADGWLDLAGTDYSSDSISVLINDRTWSAPPDSLSIDDVIIAEGTGGAVSAIFTVTRGGSLAGSATVNYSTANAGALAGSDYVAQSGTLTFADGVATMQVTVPINGDLIDEFDQGFYVNLSAASGAAITDGQGFATIVDDDPTPTVSITPRVSAREGRKSWASSFAFTVTLSAPSEKGVWVALATADGTATTADNDYIAKSGTLYFAAGVTSQTFSVFVRGDTKKEADETFFVNLTSATNATILDGRGQGIGEILNDDKR